MAECPFKLKQIVTELGGHTKSFHYQECPEDSKKCKAWEVYAVQSDEGLLVELQGCRIIK